MKRSLLKLLAAFAGLGATPVVAAPSIDMQDSFRIGSSGNAICTAEVSAADGALSDMFDRSYSMVCRDAVIPVGQLYALRLRGGDPAERLAGLRAAKATCAGAARSSLAGLGAVDTSQCKLNGLDVDYRAYAYRKGDTLYVAEGLAAYDSVLQLGLRSLVANRPVPGEITVALTGIGDPAAFARVLAGTVSPQRALAEAYRRNNSGNYAEAAEFFATLSGNDAARTARPEALANQALQRSNLGAYAEAEMLFAQAEAMPRGDPVVERQLRNFRAMHLLNQGMVQPAYAMLDRPMPPAAANAAIRELVIDGDTAARLSSQTASARRLGASEGLSPEDKAKILDAQALQLRGSALRVEGRAAEAAQALRSADSQLLVVRDGRVAATQWIRAQIMTELAEMAEKAGDIGGAESQYQAAATLVATHYPGSSSLLNAKGQLASFYARNNRTDNALATFREIVADSGEGGSVSPSLGRVFGSYFALLTGPGAPQDAAAEMFRASQLLVRPGVAQTQAILARELGGGSDEASRLFRQSVNLTRELERLRVEQARLTAPGATANPDRLQALQASVTQLQTDQLVTQSQLAQYPRYRALSNAAIPLTELQSALRPGEAYHKMIVAGGSAYALFITPEAARAYRMGASATQLDRQVDALRATISTVEQGQVVTFPFDVEAAHRLYRTLFGPIAGELAQVTNLIFEPDGAMLRLPPNLLVMDEASVRTYAAGAARPNDDGFDFRNIAWLGRDRDISTAVSPRAFRDLRQAAPSRAKAQYIGFGQNQPADAFFLPTGDVGGDPCSWSLSAWGRPISAGELNTAQQLLGTSGNQVITGNNFTDAAIKNRPDLDQYRIVHFATHGMLAPPRPECPARPSLMTSFGGPGSDGLLSFGEIFDLRLDADVVILSACDTAAQASQAANREAGLSSGGDFALDGLVRAFVGAGGRLVVASHWPVPDDFNATQRLISGMFESAPGTGTATALRAAQRKLMDDPMTSHPFYWSGFAVVGDGAAPLVRPGSTQTAAVGGASASR